MFKLATIATLIILALSVMLALLLPGITDGFRYFIVMAGIVVGLLAACGIMESRNP